MKPELQAAQELAAWLEGSYSSQARARTSPAEFSDLRLRIRRIWAQRSDGLWLYFEEARPERPAVPVRQRVYCVHSQGIARARVDVYALPEPALWHAALKNPQRLAHLSPADLKLRTGCALDLFRQTQAWVGGTRGRACQPPFPGTAYATSILRIFEERLEIWERGFDQLGKQVWGPKSGANVFEKIESR